MHITRMTPGDTLPLVTRPLQVLFRAIVRPVKISGRDWKCIRVGLIVCRPCLPNVHVHFSLHRSLSLLRQGDISQKIASSTLFLFTSIPSSPFMVLMLVASVKHGAPCRPRPSLSLRRAMRSKFATQSVNHVATRVSRKGRTDYGN